MPVGGIVYILEQAFDCRKGHISSIHTLIAIFEFDTEFDKTPILRHFRPFPTHQKSPHTTQKHLSNPYKIRLQSNLIKIFKKSIQIIQNKTPIPTPFHPTKIKHFPQSDHLKYTLLPNSSNFIS